MTHLNWMMLMDRKRILINSTLLCLCEPIFCMSPDLANRWCKQYILIFFNHRSIVRGISLYNLTWITRYCTVHYKILSKVCLALPCTVCNNFKSVSTIPRSNDQIRKLEIKWVRQVWKLAAVKGLVFTVGMSGLIRMFPYSETVGNNGYVYSGFLFLCDTSAISLHPPLCFMHSVKLTHTKRGRHERERAQVRILWYWWKEKKDCIIKNKGKKYGCQIFISMFL